MSDIDHIKSYLYESMTPIVRTIKNQHLLETIEEAGDALAGPLFHNRKVICIGNGGSMADAAHFAAELTGKYRHPREPYAAVVPDIMHLTCVANDFGYDRVFERYVEGVGKAGDALLALTTSGKSMNVINAVLKARDLGINVVLITGECEVIPRTTHIVLPSLTTSHTQELTMTLLHVLVELIEIKLQKPD